jgi:serine protease Do
MLWHTQRVVQLQTPPRSRRCDREAAEHPGSDGARFRVRFPGAMALLLLVALFGCSTVEAPTPSASQEKPAPLPLGEAGSEPLAFRRIVYRIPANQVIGTARVGRRYTEEVRWTVGRAQSNGFNVAVTDGLRDLGYDVRDEADALFDPNDGAKVRYEMAAILHDAQVDYRYAYDARREGAGEGVGTAEVEVEVHLYDAIEKRTVYRRRFHGAGRDEGYRPNPMMNAVVEAILETTRDPDFVSVVARGTASRPGESDAPRVLAACSVSEDRQLPDGLPATLEAVVEIQAGSVSGSGVIVSPDGWIVTAAHVVLDAPEVWVRLRGGLQLPAALEDADAEVDLALLRVPGRNHPCAPVRVSEERPDLGSDVFAVNRAIGEDRAPSVTRGVVSGFPVKEGRRLIQTDASLNPGSSGGPLLAPDGSIAGITVGKMVGVGVEGLGLAVPAAEAIERLEIHLDASRAD